MSQSNDGPAVFASGLIQLQELIKQIEKFKWTDAYSSLALLGTPNAYAILFRDGRIVIGSMKEAENHSTIKNVSDN